MRPFYQRWSLLIAIACLLCACGEEAATPANDAPTAAPGHSIATWYPLMVGARQIEVQAAIALPEQMQGLMHRDELGAQQGMIFLYREPRRMSFYMKNTRIPLDIGFFDAQGILQEVRQMYPYDTTSVVSRSDQIQFALEMNQGWFAQQQVRPGDFLNRQQLAEILRQRGYDPADYNL